MSTDLYDSEPDFSWQDFVRRSFKERSIDPSEPLVHEFHGGTLIPESCLKCGEPQAVPWHRSPL